MVPEDEVIADTTLVVLLCEVLAEVVLNSVLVGAVVLDLVDVDGTRSLVEDSPACAMLEIVVFEKLNLEEVLLEVAVLSPGSFDGVGMLMGIENLEDVERTENPGLSKVAHPKILVSCNRTSDAARNT